MVTGLSGSGKSSLAFDTIYAEGQRRYMESLSSFAKRFIGQVAKPDVDFVFGLSPVISIEQKTVGTNPRSTVGTMTDIASYLNLLFATIGEPHCPRTGEPAPSRTASQILEAILSLPEGTEIELRAPVFKVYGEDLDYVFTEVRKKGCRRLIVDGKPLDISDYVETDKSKSDAAESPDDMGSSITANVIDAVVDRFIVSRKHEKAIKAGIASTLLVGDGLLQAHVVKGASKADTERFYRGLCSATHHLVYGDIGPDFFVFNNPESACRTCGGLGVDKITHPELLVPDPKRSILGGCFVREAFKYNPDTWDGRMMFSLAAALDFPLDSPWNQLPESARTAILYGIEPRKIGLKSPPDTKVRRDNWEGREIGFHGIARRIERYYRHYRQRGEASSRMEAWLDKVMVEQICPDCKGARLRATRMLFTIGDRTLYDVGQMNFDELHAFLGTIKPAGRGADAGRHILKEIRGRLALLLGIGLDYLNFNRRSGTLSGGESQRIRLSTQIGSGLMGMLYVLDEPSIGLHPKDNVKMIATLERLRDIGNTLVVVEHDEDTIRAADHLVEMGPGPGVHGGRVVVQGTLEDLLACKASPTGQFLSGKRSIPAPARRRSGNGKTLVIRGARENNLKSIEVTAAPRHAHRDHRGVGIGQEHADQRGALQGALEAPRRYAHPARRARPRRRHGARPQGGQHRSVGDRPEQPIQSRHLCGVLRRHSRPLYAGAAVDRTRVPPWPLQFQRQGRPLRGVPGRRRHHHAAVLHARRRGDLWRVQGRTLQQRDPRSHGSRQDHRRRAEHVGGGRRRVLRRGAGDPPEDRGPARTGAWLLDAGPVGNDVVGRRGAADQDRDRAQHAAARASHRLHPGRAHDRTSPRRRRTPAVRVEPAGGAPGIP